MQCAESMGKMITNISETLCLLRCHEVCHTADHLLETKNG